jgi:branched-chain amino acid transport system permease protein
MSRDLVRPVLWIAGSTALAATVPFVLGSYWLSLAINMLMYVALCTAWTVFSGPTRLVSLATAAFFGFGVYVAAILGDRVPFPILMAASAGLAAVFAGLVGFATLRLSGVYIVIFSFGLSEFVRQIVTWGEATIGGTVGRYVFTATSQTAVYLQLLTLASAIFVIGIALDRSRHGWALRAIGQDEMAARHLGIDTTRTKWAAFVLSAVCMALVGTIIAPRWTYIDPSIAFNPVVSFQVLIFALFGGTRRLYGLLLGVIPLVLLFEALGAWFPNQFMILLGAVFLAGVYLLPRGVLGLADAFGTRLPAARGERHAA